MTDRDLMTLFSTAEVEPEPPLPPEFVARALSRARRVTVRRRVVGAVAALAAVALVAALLPWSGWPSGRREPATPTDRPTLPAVLATYSGLTASVADSPAGRAVVLYESGSGELFTTWQTLVAGADRDTYRTVDMTDSPNLGFGGPPALLAPNGERLLRYDVRADRFRVLDLTTGTERTLSPVPWTSNIGASVELMAWSPDNRYVAYGVPAPPPSDGRVESSVVDGRPIDQLAVLDLETGTSRRFPQLQPLFGAAFTPDGHLSVQLRRELWITTVDGQRLRQLTLPAESDLASHTAWSPDGALIATSNEAHILFADGTGTGRTPPAPIRNYNRVLGWRGPTSVLVTSNQDPEMTILEVDVHTGRKTALSRYVVGGFCEYGLQSCHGYRPQLATGLLSGIAIRPSDPDRGPWPLWAPLVLLGLIVACGLLGWRIVRRLAGRRRYAP